MEKREQVGSADGHQHKTRRSDETEWERRLASWTLGLNAILALTAVIGCVAIGWQLVLTRDALKVSIAALEENRREVAESRIKALADDKEGDERFKATLAQAASDARAQQELLRASLDQSRAALAVTQRARLIVDRCRTLGTSEKGYPRSVSCTIRNTGLVPAQDVRWNIQLDAGTGENLNSESIPAIPPKRAVQGLEVTIQRAVVGPGVVRELEAPWGDIRLYQNGVETKDPWLLPLAVGRVDYEDGFGKQRTLRFCFHETNHWYPPDAKRPGNEWEECSNFNSSN